MTRISHIVSILMLLKLPCYLPGHGILPIIHLQGHDTMRSFSYCFSSIYIHIIVSET